MNYTNIKKFNVYRILSIPFLVVSFIALQNLYLQSIAPVQDKYEADFHLIMKRKARERNYDTYYVSRKNHNALSIENDMDKDTSSSNKFIKNNTSRVVVYILIFILFGLTNKSEVNRGVSLRGPVEQKNISPAIMKYVMQKIIKNLKSEFVHELDSMKLKTRFDSNSNEAFFDTKAQNDDTDHHEQLRINVGLQEKPEFEFGNVISPNESQNILIVTRGRSGSSFLGDLLSRYPGTFYSYEPLHFKMKNPNPIKNLNLIKQVFKCSPSSEYIMHAKYWKSFLNNNFRFKNVCSNILSNDEACYIPEVYYESCQRFPRRLIKTIRLPFKDAESILRDSRIGKKLKIIFLFRDPRGRLQSLKSKVHWCSKNEERNKCNVSNLCNGLETDLFAALTLKTEFPERVKLIRYEDVCLNTSKVADELLKFLELPKSSLIDEFISSHTQGKTRRIKTRVSNYGTIRNSSLEAFAWKDNIADKDILEVQTLCNRPMKILGYNTMNNVPWDKINDSYKLIVKPILGFQ